MKGVKKMKVFTSKEFIEKLKWLVNDVPNYYHSENDSWCRYNWNNNKFMMDCVVSIKGLLWGFTADKNLPHGGGVYLSNGVADFTPDGGLDYCDDVSNNFNNIIPGEYLCMKDTGYGHAGIYLGNGKVFECTVGWGAYKCIISDISTDGTRSYNGVNNLRWTYHGKLDYIDYNDTPKPEPVPGYNYKVGDVVNIDGVYVSSDSTEKLTPAITRGTITRIVDGARNPYLLDDGNIGWVNDSCIIDEQPTVYKTITNCYWLNLRTSPSYGDNIYTAVEVGTRVEYLGMEDGWAKIRYDGKTLYCGPQYLQ
jgi:hypothetical protein